MKKKFLSLALSAVLSIGIFSTPAQEMLGSVSITAQAATVTAPSASTKSGTYSSKSGFSVWLTADDGAEIYYSKGDGYKLYTRAVRITKNTTLKCYAIKNGVKSKTVSYNYKLTPKVTISADSGSYDEPITVKLSTTASGVKLYYTLDGSKPDTNSDVYSTKGISISSSATLRVLAVKNNWTTKYYTRQYTINADIPDTSNISLLDDYESKYAYNTLTSTQKKIYAAFFRQASEHSYSMDISNLNATGNDVKQAYWAFDYENPQFFWLANGFSYTKTSNGKVVSVEANFSRSDSEAKRLQELLDQSVNKIISEAMAQDNLFDRVKVLHDAIVEMTTYTINGNVAKSEADGPLIYGIGLCEGYSKAFMYLCQSVGIECICVAGYANEPHMWNMVKLDGEWYNIDVTWDDPLKYDYFCIPTSKIKEDHTFDNLFPVPAAVSDKYSYNTVMGITEYTTATSAYNALVEQTVSNYKSGIYETTISVKAGLMDGLLSKMNSSLSSDLSRNNCSFSMWSASYSSKSLTLTLTR